MTILLNFLQIYNISGDEKYKKIIKFAIVNEIEAKELYEFMASKMKDSQLKKMFAKFAKDEERHKQILEKLLKQEKAALLFIKPIAFKVPEELKKPFVLSQMKPSEAFKIAIQNESEGMKLYTNLAESIEDPDKKTLFQNLAKMEADHKNKIEIFSFYFLKKLCYPMNVLFLVILNYIQLSNLLLFKYYIIFDFSIKTIYISRLIYLVKYVKYLNYLRPDRYSFLAPKT